MMKVYITLYILVRIMCNCVMGSFSTLLYSQPMLLSTFRRHFCNKTIVLARDDIIGFILDLSLTGKSQFKSWEFKCPNRNGYFINYYFIIIINNNLSVYMFVCTVAPQRVGQSELNLLHTLCRTQLLLKSICFSKRIHYKS